jgi:hypothetical protein
VLESSRKLRWREHSFLHSPRVPRALIWSETPIHYHLPDEALPENYATGEYTQALDESKLQDVASRLDSRILRLRNMQPGAFQGFASAARNADFDTWFRQMIHDLKWCCATQIEEYKRKRFDSLDFPAPPPLGSSAAAGFQVHLCTPPHPRTLLVHACVLPCPRRLMTFQ